jgi:hypothetical protein
VFFCGIHFCGIYSILQSKRSNGKRKRKKVSRGDAEDAENGKRERQKRTAKENGKRGRQKRVVFIPFCNQNGATEKEKEKRFRAETRRTRRTAKESGKRGRQKRAGGRLIIIAKGIRFIPWSFGFLRVLRASA